MTKFASTLHRARNRSRTCLRRYHTYLYTPLYLSQSNTWVTDSEHYLKTTQTDAKQCRSVEQVVKLLNDVAGSVKPGYERQDVRLLKLGELASKMSMEQQRREVRNLVSKQKRIFRLSHQLEQRLRRMADEIKWCEAEGREIKVGICGSFFRWLHTFFNIGPIDHLFL